MEDTHRQPGPSASAIRASHELRALISRLRRRILSAAGAEDITLGQASVLARLSDTQGVTASWLAAAEGVRHQSMAGTVASLGALGLIERRPDPEDGRRRLIALTREGQRRVAEGRRARQGWLAGELQERCTDAELQTVLAALAILDRLTRD